MQPIWISREPNHFDGSKLLRLVWSRIAERRQLAIVIKT
jgi:hypothetical protein